MPWIAVYNATALKAIVVVSHTTLVPVPFPILVRSQLRVGLMYRMIWNVIHKGPWEVWGLVISLIIGGLLGIRFVEGLRGHEPVWFGESGDAEELEVLELYICEYL